MIKFTLKCKDGHQFESWFQSSSAYDKLDAAGMVACAICGAAEVEKAIMAPSVQASRNKPNRPDATQMLPAGPGALTTAPDSREQALAALKKQVEENSEYVGLNFATQARDMHDGLTPERPIHGEAKPEEARKLIEDGVPVLSLPFVPGRKTN